MTIRSVVGAAVLILSAGVIVPGRAAPDSMSPDGLQTYSCGAERESVEGCFNTWTKLIHEGS